MLFVSTKRRELADVNGNVFLSFHCRIMKAFLDVFKIISWDLKVPAIPCYVVGELGPLLVFVPQGPLMVSIPKAFGTLPVDYFVCLN